MYMRNANAFLQGSSSLYVESDSSGPYKEEGSLINSTRFSRGQASVSTPTPESHTAMRNNTLSDEVGALILANSHPVNAPRTVQK